jgi:nitrate reductase (cytochrome), electron transfer subunit
MKPTVSAIIAVALLLGIVAMPVAVTAQDAGLTSLRGSALIDESAGAGEIRSPDDNQRFPRAYRQQPPLVPHRTETYQIDLKVNRCMRCHDWPYNVEEGAPKISETHYVDRDGNALDTVSPGRWFCTQCHVSQLRASPLVSNTFRSALEVE